MAKLPSLPLFTDKFIAETVHLTNEALGMYIRLLCFAWTKKAEPFTEDQAYRICQCRLDECKDIVNLVLKEGQKQDGIQLPMAKQKHLLLSLFLFLKIIYLTALKLFGQH